MTSHHGIICFVAAAGLLVTAGNAVETKQPASGEVMDTSLQAKAPTQEPPPVQAPKMDPVNHAVARGIQYIMSRQQPTGVISDLPVGEGIYSTVMTSLSIMAFLATGHQPADQTREGEAIRRGLSFVLRPDRMDSTGYFGGVDMSSMYGHGVTTLMLAEVLGMGVDDSQDRLIRERCRKAVDIILRSQKVAKSDPSMRGGWRYAPNSPDSDVSATVWLLMALRAAKNAEFEVPGEAIDSAVGFIKRCYSKAGACAYTPLMPLEQRRAGGAAAGLLSLQMCGAYDGLEVAGSAAWLRSHRLKSTNDMWFFYWIYYYAQAMHQRGGAVADEERAYVERTLLPLQAKDGAWPGGISEKICGNVYTTSMAILALSVKYHFLPIYQQ